jgi:spore germination protein GerM
MNKNIWIILIIIVVIGFIFFLGASSDKSNAPEKVAEEWIINNSSTYIFDGSNLKLLSIENGTEENEHIISFTFNSSAAGYGDRTGEVLAQVITPHEIRLVVENGKITEVKEAITDGVFNEITKKMINIVYQKEEVKIYFLNIKGDQEELVEVERHISLVPGLSLPHLSIIELLDGPSSEETDSGIFSMINPGTVMNELTLEEKTITIDFNQKLQENVAGSATVIAIRNQIEKTLMQFDYIEKVVISINGESEKILQP